MIGDIRGFSIERWPTNILGSRSHFIPKQEVQFSIVVNALQGLILSLKTSTKQKVLGKYNGQDGQPKRK